MSGAAQDCANCVSTAWLVKLARDVGHQRRADFDVSDSAYKNDQHKGLGAKTIAAS
jgi:hypothetical protein